MELAKASWVIALIILVGVTLLYANTLDNEEEEYGIYTAGGLTNDKEGSFIKFINKLNKKKR